MKIKCIVGKKDIRMVTVNGSDPISVLLDKLSLSDKKTKFVYNGQTHQIYSNLTFDDIGMKDGARIIFIYQALSGCI